MSKVDPRTLSNVCPIYIFSYVTFTFTVFFVQVDERTTLLLEAARREVDPHAGRSLELQRLSTLRSRRSRPSTALARSTTSNRSVNLPSSTHGMIVASPIEGSFSIPNEDFDVDEHRAIVEKTEEPGLDSLRGFAGAFGTIIRTRRRTREFSAISALRSNEPSEVGDPPSQDILRSVSSRSSSSMRHTNWFRGVWSSPRESQFQIMPKNGGDLEKNGGRVLEIEDMREEGSRNVVIGTRHIDSHGSTRSRVLPAAGATPLDISTVHPTFRTAHSEPLIQTTSRIHFEQMQTTSAPVVPGSDIVSKFREGMT